MSAFGRLAVVGGGRMGEALVAGLLDAGTDAGSLVVVEPVAERREALAASYGVSCVPSSAEALPGADVVLLAVKPQVIDAVAEQVAAALPSGTLVVSIAAGVSTAHLESLLPAGTAVVRVMPNTPAMVREGMSVVSGGSEASRDQVEGVRRLFSAVGKAVIVDERFQDACTAVSGSGPAYVAIFIDALTRAGVGQGLAHDVAEELSMQTVKGTAELLEKSGQHPAELVDAVSSPGGTTIAAVEELEAKGFRAAVAAAVAAAAARAKELGS